MIRRKMIRIGISLTVLVLTIIVFFIIGELILRTFYESPDKSAASLLPCLRSAPHLGILHELIPNSICIFKGTEVKINSQGLRDYEYSIKKPPNTLRIAVLGDSITFGWGVELNESYPKLLEFYLNNFENKYEIINFAVPGLNTLGETNLLERKVLAYNPDIILIGYYLNDPECYWEKICEKELLDATQKAYRLKFSLPINDQKKNEILQKWLFLGFLEEKLDNLLHKIKIRNIFQSRLVKLHKGDSLTWKNVQKNFNRISKIAKKDDIKVVIVIFPGFDFIDKENNPFQYIHQQVSQEAKSNGFYVIDLGPFYQQYPWEEIKLSLVDGHPNVKGHKIAADAIYDFIKKEKII